MDSSLPFSVTESYHYQELLDEAIETLLSANVELGPERQVSQRVPVEELVAPLRDLKKAQAFFSQNLTIQRLSLQNFKERGLQPTPDIQQWLRTHHLYLVQVPITLKPAFGWAFTRLECGVVFIGRESEIELKVHDIYPDNVWSEIMHLHTHITLGLNTAFTFRAEVSQIDVAYQGLSGGAKARVAATVDADSQLVIGPLNYGIHRPEVLSEGKENSRVFWQLDGNSYVQHEEPYLAVVLRVPREVSEVDVQGRFIAYHKFDFRAARLTDWSGTFREKLRSFFSNGIPLEDRAVWKDVFA